MVWGGSAHPVPDWLAVIHLNNKEAARELKINHNNETLFAPSPHASE